MVLWLVVLLSAIGAEYSLSMRTDLMVTESVKEEAEAYYMAVAGFNAALGELMQPVATQYIDSSGHLAFSTTPLTTGSTGEGVLAAPMQRSMTLETGSYRYRIDDEDGKFSVRTLSFGSAAGATGISQAEAFKEMLRGSGVSDEVQLSTIVDSIVDWMDPGDEHQLNGAEDNYYERHYEEQGMDAPYKTPDARRLNVVDELLLVRGMTPEILYGSAAVHTASMVGGTGAKAIESLGQFLGIFQHISVFATPQPRNLLTADPAVVNIYAPEQADQIATQRASGLPSPEYSQVSGVFTVLATGRSTSGKTQHTIRGIVRRRGVNPTLIRIEEWDDNYLVENLGSEAAETVAAE